MTLASDTRATILAAASLAARFAGETLIHASCHLDEMVNPFSERVAGDYLDDITRGGGQWGDAVDSLGVTVADDDPTVCYFCGDPTERAIATDYDYSEFVCETCEPPAPAANPHAAEGDSAGESPTPAGSPTCKWCGQPIEMRPENHPAFGVVGAWLHSVSDSIDGALPRYSCAFAAGGTRTYATPK